MKFYFATQLSPDTEQVNTLIKMGGDRKLISYFYIKKEAKSVIDYFLKTGRRENK